APEITEAKLLKEQNQTAEFDRHTGNVRVDEPGSGKTYATFARQIEGLPVWSSRVIVGLTKERGIGFFEAHCPEIPASTLAEARHLANMVRQGWKPPEHPGSTAISVEAGIIHSPAVGFVMDIFPVIRIIYEPNDRRFNKRPVLYLDRHGNPVPVPRQFDIEPQPSPGKRPTSTASVPVHRRRYRE